MAWARRLRGTASLRTWLYRIATNRCRNALRDARRRPAEPTPPFDPPEPTRRREVTWLQPYPDALLDDTADSVHAREAVELAFVVGLRHLPPRQTATLVLRDVLGYSADEVADLLGTSPTAVKGTLQRARAQLRGHRTTIEGTALPDSPRERDLARRFADAFSTGDVAGVIALLTDDAWLAMPPAPHEYHGRAAIAAFLDTFTAWRRRRRFRLVPTRANTQPAFGGYLTEPGTPTAHPAGLLVLTPGADRLRGVTWFLGDGITHRFGLPETVDCVL